MNLSQHILTVTQRVTLFNFDLNSIILSLIGLSIIGSIWLWILLISKDKLVWVLQTGNKRSKEYKQTKKRMEKNKKIGLILLLAPIALFIFRVIFSIFTGLMGNAGAIFFPITYLVHISLTYLWLPSIIIGIIFLKKQK